MKAIKKVGAVALSIALILVMLIGSAGTVFAVPVGDEGKAVTSQKGDVVKFTKVVTAPEGITIPGKEFDFTVEQMTTKDGVTFTKAGAEVPNYDAKTKQAALVNGLSGKAKVTTGIAAAENFYLGKIELNTITKPGVYVFKVTESTADALADGYGWRNTGKEEYLMRVYAKKTDKGMSYETTFVKATTTEGNTTTELPKLEGPTTDDQDKVTAKGGILFTNNFTKAEGTDGDGTPAAATKFTVSKAVNDKSNGLADKNDEFTFSLTITNVDVNSNVNKASYKANVGGKEYTFATGTPTEFKLKAGESLVFTDAIPAGTKFVVTEGNLPNNYDLEGIKIKANGVEADNGTTQMAEAKVLGEKTNSAAFTNKFEEISVTGVALRIMPFVLILAIAAAGAVIYRKAKKIAE